MSSVARVESLDPIKDFRVYLTKFQEAAGLALGDADSDVQRVQMWLEGEQMTFWTGQIRKRQELLARAEDAMRQKTLYKDSTGHTQSAVDEQKIVQTCKKNLMEAQQKLVAVKAWSRRLQKEQVLYRGGVAAFSNDVSSGVPTAIGYLSGAIENIEKYLEVEAVGAGDVGGGFGGTGAGGEAAGAGMSRGAEGTPIPKSEIEEKIDPVLIRSWLPDDSRLTGSSALPPGPVNMAFIAVSEFQRAAAGAITTAAASSELAEEPVPDSALVAIDPAAGAVKGVYVLSVDSAMGYAWVIGSVEAKPETSYNKTTVADLKAGRPDLTEVLNLPAGSLAIIGAKGLVAVYNLNNENLLAVESDVPTSAPEAATETAAAAEEAKPS